MFYKIKFPYYPRLARFARHAVALIGVLWTMPSLAQTNYYWRGGGVTNGFTITGNFRDGPESATNLTPSSSNANIFNFGFGSLTGPAHTTATNGTAGFNIHQILFGTVTDASNVSFTISGSSITLVRNSGVDPIITQNSAMSHLISAPIVVGGPPTQNLTLTGNGAGIISLTGGMTGNRPLIKSGSSVYLLSGTIDSGSVTIENGMLIAGSATAISAQNFILEGGVLGLGNGNFTGALGTADGQVSWSGTVGGGFAAYGADRLVNLGGASTTMTWASTASFLPDTAPMILGHAAATHTLTFQNPINFNGAARTVNVGNGSAGIDAELSGLLSNGGLTKSGLGTLAVTGNSNSYAGGTIISAGTLLANNTTGSATGTGSITVGTDGTLGGTGRIAPGSGNGITLNGDLLAGLAGGSAATLSIILNSASFSFDPNSTAYFDLFGGYNSGVFNSAGFGGDNDLVSFTGSNLGTINLTGTLSVNPFNAVIWAAGSAWQLFDWTGLTVNGSFSAYDLPDISAYDLEWDTSELYQTGVISIAYAIPEPSRFLLAGIGVLGLLARRRRSNG